MDVVTPAQDINVAGLFVVLYVTGCVIAWSITFMELHDSNAVAAWTLLWPILLPYRVLRSAWRGFWKEVK